MGNYTLQKRKRRLTCNRCARLTPLENEYVEKQGGSAFIRNLIRKEMIAKNSL